MRRWLTALLALGSGVGLSAALLVFADPERNSVEVYAAARDIPAGAVLASDSLVLVRVKDAPPVPPGSRVDLMVVDGAPDHLSVSPFALGVEVQASVAGGLVVVVSSRQAPAFVYAAAGMHLTAIIAAAGTGDGAEAAVSTADQAMAVAAQP